MPRIARWIRIAEEKRRFCKRLEQVMRVIESYQRGRGSQLGCHLAKKKVEEMILRFAKEEFIMEELVELHALVSNLNGGPEIMEEAARRTRVLIHENSR